MKIKSFIIALVLAFIFSQILNKEVFFVNSPRINPLFIAKVKNLPQALIVLVNKTPSSQLAKEEKPRKLIPLFKGVYADEAEANDNNTIYIKITDPNIQLTSQKITLPDGTIIQLYKPILEK